VKRTKNGTIAIILASLLLIGIVAASIISNLNYPQTATIAEAEALVLLNGSEWANNTKIEWGIIIPSVEKTFDFDIQNIGQVPFTAVMVISNLPEGWTETYSGNNTLIIVGETLEGTLSLTASKGSTGTHAWDSCINLDG
jgi:hypothetical protein